MNGAVNVENACIAYEQAQATYVRTPKHDVACDRKFVARDQAYDWLVILLTAYGAVYHHNGNAFWVEYGELQKAKINTGFRAKKERAK